MRKKKKDELEVSFETKPAAESAAPPAQVSKVTALQEPEIRFASKPSVPFEKLKLKSSFSLNEVTNYPPLATVGNSPVVAAPEVKIINKEVTLEIVKSAILKFADEKQNQGARQLATIFKTSDISLSEQTITLTINNETQKEQLQIIRQDFVDDLRKQLQNSAVTLEIQISESAKQAKAYKPVDIFKAMSEKNPALLELKKRFDLEIDY